MESSWLKFILTIYWFNFEEKSFEIGSMNDLKKKSNQLFR